MPKHRPRFGRTTKASAPRVMFAAFAVVCAALALGVALSMSAVRSTSADGRPVLRETQEATASPATQIVAQPATVEMPDVVGMRRVDAEMVLAAAGLSVSVIASGSGVPPDGTESMLVAEQEPLAGAFVPTGVSATITLVEPRSSQGLRTGDRSHPERVVCIDPGHQARGDSTPEPLGPGSKRTKPRVTGGATGVKTGVPEYEVTLQIAMNLKARLEKLGIKVVMTRTTNDVNVSNSERAAIANRARADLFVRIHCDGNPDPAIAGISTLYPARNKWTRAFASQSQTAARLVQKAVVASTGAVDRKTEERSDLAGFNWSEVPCILVECGFLSNPVEDRLLVSPHYQDKISAGIADGVSAYFAGIE